MKKIKILVGLAVLLNFTAASFVSAESSTADHMMFRNAGYESYRVIDSFKKSRRSQLIKKIDNNTNGFNMVLGISAAMTKQELAKKVYVTTDKLSLEVVKIDAKLPQSVELRIPEFRRKNIFNNHLSLPTKPVFPVKHITTHTLTIPSKSGNLLFEKSLTRGNDKNIEIVLKGLQHLTEKHMLIKTNPSNVAELRIEVSLRKSKVNMFKVNRPFAVISYSAYDKDKKLLAKSFILNPLEEVK